MVRVRDFIRIISIVSTQSAFSEHFFHKLLSTPLFINSQTLSVYIKANYYLAAELQYFSVYIQFGLKVLTTK